jgi:hypothetical protein
MVRRASGVTSYYNRVQPANPAARTRRIERSEPKTYIDVTSEEVRRQETEDLNFKPDLLGQAITALAIALGALVLVYSIVRWLCGF